ncbi:MAG TPA: hypothetical protein DDZ51_25770 [Planctomycetaceae bacterium]|nr:hypothetical protein [Planctomycetaceae bacterium]
MFRLGVCGASVGCVSELPVWPAWPSVLCDAWPLDCAPPVPVDPLLPVREVDEPLADELIDVEAAEVDVEDVEPGDGVAAPSAN